MPDVSVPDAAQALLDAIERAKICLFCRRTSRRHGVVEHYNDDDGTPCVVDRLRAALAAAPPTPRPGVPTMCLLDHECTSECPPTPTAAAPPDDEPATGACGHPVDVNDPHMRHKAPCVAVNWPESCNADACSCERVCASCCDRCPATDAQTVVAAYLTNAPEQSDWSWEDHCEGMASGIVAELEAAGRLRAAAGSPPPTPEDAYDNYVAERYPVAAGPPPTNGPTRQQIQQRVGAWHAARFPAAEMTHVTLKAIEELGECAEAVNATVGVNSATANGALSVPAEAADVVIALMVLIDRWNPGIDLMAEVERKLLVLEDPDSGHRSALLASHRPDNDPTGDDDG